MSGVEVTCIIDDDPIFIFTMKKLMELSQFTKEIVTYENGKDALEGFTLKLQNDEPLPDVILLDLNMPLLNGWEFLDELSKWEIKQPILIYVVTSSIDPEDIERAKEYSLITHYLIKPITVQKLTEILQNFKNESEKLNDN